VLVIGICIHLPDQSSIAIRPMQASQNTMTRSTMPSSGGGANGVPGRGTAFSLVNIRRRPAGGASGRKRLFRAWHPDNAARKKESNGSSSMERDSVMQLFTTEADYLPQVARMKEPFDQIRFNLEHVSFEDVLAAGGVV